MSTFFNKPVESLISTKSETITFKSLTDSGITYTLCNREVLSNPASNYFISFNLPYEDNVLFSGSSLCKNMPELYQLNVDRVVIIPIGAGEYNDMIDGRSIKLTVPQFKNSTSLSSKTIVSSTYNTLEKRQDNILLGKNIAFLFSDDINLPYTGTTTNETFDMSSHAVWNTNNYLDRPAAVSYQNLSNADINSDARPWSTVNLAVPVPEKYPTNTNQGYNYDIPVGFAALDKGFLVITHPDIVDSFKWNSGYTYNTGALNVSSGTTNIWFDSMSGSTLSFREVNINYKTSVVCMALPGEFYFSNNPSWSFSSNLEEYNLGTNNFDPTYITEIGLYNRQAELIAIAKLDRTKEKGYTNVFTFTLELDI